VDRTDPVCALAAISDGFVERDAHPGFRRFTATSPKHDASVVTASK
jgi:hypothetical protein